MCLCPTLTVVTLPCIDHVAGNPSSSRYTTYTPKSSQTSGVMQTAKPAASSTSSYMPSSAPSYMPSSASSYMPSSAPSYTPSSASYGSTGSYTSTQEKVISNYIAQKAMGGGGGGGVGKKPYNPNNQAVYFCDICKISCASSMVSPCIL